MGMNEPALRRALGWSMLVSFLLVSAALAPILSATACPAARLDGGYDCVTAWWSLLGVETSWPLWLGSCGALLVVAVLLIVVVPRLLMRGQAR